MTRFFCCILALFAAFAAVPAQASGLLLKGRLHISTVAAPDKPPAVSDSDYLVAFYPQEIVVKANGAERIYDFNDKQLYVFDDAKRTYAAYPLYTTPVYNHNERIGRLRLAYIAKMTQEGRRPDDPASPFSAFQDVDIDTLYASAGEAKTSALVHFKETGGQTVFSSGEKSLGDVVYSTAVIHDALQSSYRRYLVYEPVLHPDVELRIAGAGKSFDRLHYVTSEGGSTTDVTITIASAEPLPEDAPRMPQGYTRTYTGAAALDAAIRRAGTAPAPGVKDFEAKISGFTAAKDPLRAALAAIDMRLTLGDAAADRSGPATAAMRAAAADPKGAAALAAMEMTPRSTEEFKQLMDAFTASEKAAPDYSYVLEVFRANDIRAVLEPRTQKLSPDDLNALDQARKSLAAAIIANPWMTEAYCDLGEAYYHAYDLQRAGIFWERAELINPGYPTLRKILALRAQAEKDFPEYF